MDLENLPVSEKQRVESSSLDQDQLISKKMALTPEESEDFLKESLKKIDSKPAVQAHPAKADDAVTTEKNYFSAIEEKAKELFEKNLFSQAESLLQALHTHRLGSASTYSLQASCYHQKNQFKKALALYQRALALDPLYLEALLNLSLLCFDLGDYKKAVVYYNKVRQILAQKQENQWKSDMAYRHLQLAQNYYSKSYYHESLLEFLKARSYIKKSKSLPLHLKVIRCLWKLNRRGEAVQKLLTLKRENPRSVDVLLLLGEFYFYMKKITFAILEWERVLKLDSKNTQALKWLSKTQNIQSVEENHFA